MSTGAGQAPAAGAACRSHALSCPHQDTCAQFSQSRDDSETDSMPPGQNLTTFCDISVLTPFKDFTPNQSHKNYVL